MAFTGDRLVAIATGFDQQNTSGTTTSVTFTATLTGGTACGIAFIAPPSGVVWIYNTCAIGPGVVAYDFCDFQVRAGGVVGSGAIIRSPSDNTAARHADANIVRFTVVTPVIGLTPGSTYNVQQQFRVNSGTGQFLDKLLGYQPQL